MRIHVILSILLIMITCTIWSQDDNSKQNTEPKAQWRVNKDYDKDGNLIAYDSVYVKSYSNLRSLNKADLDSLFQKQADLFKNFKMPNMNLSGIDSLRFDMNRFFEGFEMPNFDRLHVSPDSLRQQHPFFKQLLPDNFDMKKEFEKMRQAFENNQKQKSSTRYKEKSL